MKAVRLCLLVLVCMTTVSLCDVITANDAKVKLTMQGGPGVSQSASASSESKPVYQESGDIVYEWTETASPASIVTEFIHKVPVTSIVDGKVVTIFKTSKIQSSSQSKFKKLKSIWKETVQVSSVSRVLEGFGSFLGEISAADYALFSHIATTDYNKYWSDYNFWEVKDMDLGLALTKMSAVYKSAIRSEDIDMAVEAIQRCDDGYVAMVLDSSAIDSNNQDGWTVYSEFFAATCSKNSSKNQIFGWAGSKSGSYLPGAFSQSNANTVTYIAKKWLLLHISMLVSCKSSPVKKMYIWQHPEESSSN